MRSWDYWAGHHPAESLPSTPIDIADFDSIGGLDHALSQHADEAYDGLPSDAHRTIARKMFQALTERGEDNREVRRPTSVAQIAAVADAIIPDVVSVVEAFHRQGRSFVTTSTSSPLDGSSVIDISHESLIRLWERLRAWVVEESESAHLYKRLAEDAALHAQQRASLLRDPTLQNALDWRTHFNPTAEWASRYSSNFAESMSYLDKSCEARAAEQAALERQRAEELRRARRNLAFASAAGFFLLIAASAATIGTWQYKKEARVAKEANRMAQQKTDAEKAAEQETAAALKVAQEKEAQLRNSNDLTMKLQKKEQAENQDLRRTRSDLDRQVTISTEQAARRKQKEDLLLNSSSQLMFDFTYLSSSTRAIPEIRGIRESAYLNAIKVSDEILEEELNNDALLLSAIARSGYLAFLRENNRDADAKRTSDGNLAVAECYLSGKSPCKVAGGTTPYRQLMGGVLLAASANYLALNNQPREAIPYAVRATPFLDSAETAILADKREHSTWRLIRAAYAMVGTAHKKNDALDAAISAYEKALFAQQKSMDPSDSDVDSASFKKMLFYVQEELAELDVQAGRRSEALTNFKNSLNTAADPALKPADADYLKSDLISIYEDRGALYLKPVTGDVSSEDRSHAEADLQQAEHLALGMPTGNADQLNDKIASLVGLGDKWHDLASSETDKTYKDNYLQNALRNHTEALRLDLQLAKDDTSVRRQQSLFWTESGVGYDQFDLGEYQKARSHYQARVAAAAKAGSDSDDIAHHLAEAYRTLSILDTTDGKIPGAIADDDQRIAALQPLLHRDNVLDSDRRTMLDARTDRALLYLKPQNGSVSPQQRARAEADFAEAESLALAMSAATPDQLQARLSAFQILGNKWSTAAGAESDETQKNAYLRSALRDHEESLHLDRELAKSDSSVKRQRSLYWTEYYVGHDHYQLKDLSRAQPYYLRSAEAQQIAADLEPADSSLRDSILRDLADGYRLLAYIDDAIGDTSGAIAADSKRIVAMLPLISRPKVLHSDWRPATDALTGRASLYFKGEKGIVSEQQRALGEADFARAETIAAGMPSLTVAQRREKLDIFQDLADKWHTLAESENLETRKKTYIRDSLRDQEVALRLDSELAKDDVSATRQDSLRYNQLMVGRDLTDLEEYADARAHLRSATEAAEAALRLAPSADYRRYLSSAYRWLSTLEQDANDLPAAIAAYAKSIDALQPLVRGANVDPDDKSRIANLYGNRAWLEVLNAQFPLALADAQQGLAYDPTQVWIAVNEAHAYLFLGRREDALKIYQSNASIVLSDSHVTFLETVLADLDKLANGNYPGVDVQLAREMRCTLSAQLCSAKSAAN
jgi:hypothetical protein